MGTRRVAGYCPKIDLRTVPRASGSATSGGGRGFREVAEHLAGNFAPDAVKAADLREHTIAVDPFGGAADKARSVGLVGFWRDFRMAFDALFAVAFQVGDGAGNGAFEARLGEVDAVDGQGEFAGWDGGVMDSGLGAVDAGQFPLVDGDLFDQGLFHIVLGHPGGGEPLQVLVEFRLVFAGDDGGFGAEAVDEAIEAGALLAFGSVGTCRFLRIAPVGTYLIDSRHSYLFYRAEPIWGGRKAIQPQMNTDKRR